MIARGERGPEVRGHGKYRLWSRSLRAVLRRERVGDTDATERIGEVHVVIRIRRRKRSDIREWIIDARLWRSVVITSAAANGRAEPLDHAFPRTKRSPCTERAIAAGQADDFPSLISKCRARGAAVIIVRCGAPRRAHRRRESVGRVAPPSAITRLPPRLSLLAGPQGSAPAWGRSRMPSGCGCASRCCATRSPEREDGDCRR